MRCGSVFSGIGLLDFGLTLAGFEHAWLCESDPWRREILAMRWPEAAVYPDIRELGDDLEPVDLIAGGFPCRGISSAGKREGFGHPETALWREQLRLIRLLRPRYCLVENVAALLTLHGGECFAEVLAGLAESGYDCWWDVLPAAAVGGPHLRERVFVVAHHPEVGRGAGPGLRTPQPDGQRGRRPDDGYALDASDPDRPRLEGAGLQGATADRVAADADEGRRSGGAERDGQPLEPGEQAPLGHDADGRDGAPWGAYAAAIRRWEAILGRPAPEPLVRRLDARGAARLARSALSAYGDGVQVHVAELLGRMIVEHAAQEAA